MEFAFADEELKLFERSVVEDEQLVFLDPAFVDYVESSSQTMAATTDAAVVRFDECGMESNNASPVLSGSPPTSPARQQQLTIDKVAESIKAAAVEQASAVNVAVKQESNATANCCKSEIQLQQQQQQQQQFHGADGALDTVHAQKPQNKPETRRSLRRKTIDSTDCNGVNNRCSSTNNVTVAAGSSSSSSSPSSRKRKQKELNFETTDIESHLDNEEAMNAAAAAAEDSLIDDEQLRKRQKRLQNNRHSAQMSRLRKKIFVEELQQTVQTLSQNNHILNERVATLTKEKELLETTVARLTALLAPYQTL
jgi:hypothetical protein